jgi:hypothetical protein
MKRILLLSIIASLLIISFVNAQIGIYTPVGEPEIQSVSAEAVPRSGADITINIKNIADERGNFEVYAECDKGFEVGSWWRGDIEAGETETAEINVYREGYCSETITCKVIAQSLSEKDEQSVSFKNDCSLCGTDFASCSEGSKWCEDGNIIGCGEYCLGGETIERCNEGCKFNKGNYICKENIESNLNIWMILSVILAIILIAVLYKLLKKK